MSHYCPTCGKPYEAELRQLRLGADEPAVEIKCMCDSSVEMTQFVCSVAFADVTVGSSASDTASSSNTLSIATSSLIEIGGAREEEQEIRFDPRLSKLLYNTVSTTPRERGECGTPVSVFVDGSIQSARLRIRNDEYPTAKYTTSRTPVCPGMTLCRSVEMFPDLCDLTPSCPIAHTSQWYRLVVKSKVVSLPEWRLRCDYYPLEGRYSSELEFLGSRIVSEATVQEALVWLHSSYGHVKELSRYVPPQLVQSCKLSTLSVIDVILPPDGDMVFRAKVDGESAWAVDCGYMWYICRPNPNLDVISWTRSSVLLEFGSDISIVRVEHMSDGSLVYIDVLAMGSKALPVPRPYIPAYASIEPLRSKPRVIVRPDFDTREEAEASRSSSKLPTDGVLAIDRLSSLAYRIKKPIVDLMRSNRSMSYIGHKSSMPTFPPIRGTRVGRIYECTLFNDGGKPAIESYIPRSDKPRPNRSDVVVSAANRVLGINDDCNVIASKIVSFSFSAREYVYYTAGNSLITGSLVIDVGSGRMQSIAYMEQSSQCYFLCDPVIDVSRLRNKRGITDATRMSYSSIISLMKKMNQGRVKYAIYKDTISSLVEKQHVMQYILNNCIPLTYCFSLSYTHQVFLAMASKGATQVGCVYLYDLVGADGYLFNDSYSYMCLDGSNRSMGKVKVYPDEEYTEPAITSQDLGKSTLVMSMLDCVPNLRLSPDRLRPILSSMYIVRSE